ncbi:zf-TFIIB domain-containing protein [Leucobacter sp. W1038]|uniref:TFIIB-type zinc ribbon-containing protein n=1 Tax=Leucobacter sp. W1038 TaxID=3438281 RepID=UPI003D98DB0D
MNCPTDGTTLLMSERHGVQIDYCPQCRGVWLDRGELDKILERVQVEAASIPASSYAQPAQQAAPAAQPSYQQPRYDDRREHRDSRDYRDSDSKYRKKKSPFDFLGDILG